MAQITVNFTFHTGLKRNLFRNVKLSGSWDSTGKFSTQWTEVPMTATQDETGCVAFKASVSFDASAIGTIFQWGVIADLAGAPNTWVVVTEVPDPIRASAIEPLPSGPQRLSRIIGLCPDADSVRKSGRHRDP